MPKKWCEEKELSTKTISVLEQEELNTAKALISFDVAELNELTLSRGQYGILRRVILELQIVSCQPRALLRIRSSTLSSKRLEIIT